MTKPEPSGLTKTAMAEKIRQLERMLDDARRERDRLAAAVRWALGETTQPPHFEPRKEGDPPYWWRRTLRSLAFGRSQ